MALQELYFQSAKDLSIQLITISSAVIGISITFIEKFKLRSNVFLRLSWLAYIVSLLFGALTIGALTGHVAQLAASGGKFEGYSAATELWARCQLGTFFVATGLLICFGWQQSNVGAAETPVSVAGSPNNDKNWPSPEDESQGGY